MRRRLVPGVLLWALASGAAFLRDPILGTAVLIAGAVLLALVVAAADWDQHSSFEERELARARRRKEKWAQQAGSRARDRARWEAHRARRADRTAAAGDAER